MNGSGSPMSQPTMAYFIFPPRSCDGSDISGFCNVDVIYFWANPTSQRTCSANPHLYGQKLPGFMISAFPHSRKQNACERERHRSAIADRQSFNMVFLRPYPPAFYGFIAH